MDGLLEDSLFDSLLTHVSDSKLDKIRKFLRSEDAHRALLADLLVRYILTSQHGVRKQEISFGYNEFGKPSLKGIKQLHFNISHSDKWVVCAVGDEPVGADVERIVPINMDVAETYFSKYECEKLFSLNGPEQLSFFYDLWTCKESYLKLNGTGLSQPLDFFSVIISDEGNAAISLQSGVPQSVYLKQFEIDEQYKMAVCASKADFGAITFIPLQDIVNHFT